jgi:hypothetical protein
VSAGALPGLLAEGAWVATALCAAVLILGVVALLRAPRDKAVEVLAGIAQIVAAIRRRHPGERTSRRRR